MLKKWLRWLITQQFGGFVRCAQLNTCKHHNNTRPSQQYYIAGRAWRCCPDRSAAPLLSMNAAPGTIVWSDEWAAYNTVSSLPNVAQHDTVNHMYMYCC